MNANTNNIGAEQGSDVNPHKLMKSWIVKAEKIYSPLIQYFKNLRPETYVDFIYDRRSGVSVTFKAVAGEVYGKEECWSDTLRDTNEYVPTSFYFAGKIIRVHYKLKSMVI